MSWGSKKQTKKGEMVNFKIPKETVTDVLKLPIADLSFRGINKKITEIYGVRMAVSEEDGKTPTAIYFPYYDQSDKLCGFKKRDLTIDKNDDYHFTAIGKVSVGCKMFGQTISEKIKRKHLNIVVVEGEPDLLAYAQVGLEHAESRGYKDMLPFVVSIGMGTANAVENTLSNEKYLKTFEKITLAFDNDSATAAEKKKGVMKGIEATNAVANALIGNNIYIAKQPDGCKDANDALMSGKKAELINNYVFEASKFTGEKILSAKDISLESILEPKVEGVYVEAFPALMHKIHGFRTGELWVLTAPSGVGKSSICSEFMFSFLKDGHKTGAMMLEENETETMQRMLARRLQINYNEFKHNPASSSTLDQIKEAYEWLISDDKFFVLDHFGSMPIDDLLSKINLYHKLHGVKYIILDHLSMVISGSRVSDERKELDIVMTELAAYCAANDVCIIAVSHLNRDIAKDFKPAKGKENEPFWVPVGKESMRGSASLEQLAWGVLSLEPQIMPDKSRGNVRIGVLKNRPWGYLGIADEFKMNDKTGLLEVVTDSCSGDF